MSVPYVSFGETQGSNVPSKGCSVVIGVIFSLAVYGVIRHKEEEEGNHTDKNTTTTESTTVTQTAETPVIGDIAEVID